MAQTLLISETRNDELILGGPVHRGPLRYMPGHPINVWLSYGNHSVGTLSIRKAINLTIHRNQEANQAELGEHRRDTMPTSYKLASQFEPRSCSSLYSSVLHFLSKGLHLREW